jgi:hypothetical protein
VIPSKQRPRKITARGEDGLDYVFLLKGHEDLRQDERVMQLFGQVHPPVKLQFVHAVVMQCISCYLSLQALQLALADRVLCVAARNSGHEYFHH